MIFREANFPRRSSVPGPFQLTKRDTFTYNSHAAARSIASIRCGSSWTATLITQQKAILPAAMQNSSLGGNHSILKFIERNWGLATMTRRSRDNFPNPITTPGNPYAPVNSPAIGDLFSLFDFDND